MLDYLGLSHLDSHVIPLGIDHLPETGISPPRDQPIDDRPFTVGYFARIAPEKGLLQCVESFMKFHKLHPQTKLKAGGYLGANQKAYFNEVLKVAETLGEAFEYVGSPDSYEEKSKFYQSVDLVTVPTVFLEPKGIYTLESLSHRVPVVMPHHGAFPELIESTGGGLTYPAGDDKALVACWEKLLTDKELYAQMATQGHQNIKDKHLSESTARALVEVIDG